MIDIEGKTFLVYGNGLSGTSAAQALTLRGGKVELVSDKDGVFCVPPDGDYALAIISPGIRRTHGIYGYCAARGIKAVGEAWLGFELAKCPIIGVTGTNGKTTTVRLIADMVGGVACGNIGYPITTAVSDDADMLVCELSSFQLCGGGIKPKVAVITNMTADHIDWHGSIHDYYRSKCAIADNMDSSDTLVLGTDITVKALASLKTGARLLRCAEGAPVDGAYTLGGWFYYLGERVCEVSRLRLQGEHNIKNALCAIVAAMSVGADKRRVTDALTRAQAAGHRLNDIGSYCGKRWIDDSKSTNISSCLAAVKATAGRICLIAGGRDKGLDYYELFASLDSRVTDIVVMGESAKKLQTAARAAGKSAVAVSGLSQAVKQAAQSSAEVVLLSPACSSFDEFASYAERGEAFVREVQKLCAH